MLDSVKEILRTRRADALGRAAFAESKANRLPEYVALERQIRTLTRALAEKDSPADEQHLQELLRRQADFLMAQGLTLEPKFTCPVCKDTGAFEGAVCSCVGEILREQLQQGAFSAPYRVNFSALDFSSQEKNRDCLEKISAKLETFVDRFDSTRFDVILLTGSVGGGKTLLASCTYNELGNRGHSVLWLTASALGRIGMDLCFGDKGREILDTMMEADFLVLDDLGTEPLYRNVSLSTLYSVLNDRIQSHKKTMITTNLSTEQLHMRYGERIFSRLIDKQRAVTLALSGKDARLVK